MEITEQQEQVLKDIYKRLCGYPLNFGDRDDKFLKVGAIVKVYYDDDPNMFVFGIIKYNLQYNNYYVKMNKPINDFNNGSPNYYLNSIANLYSKFFSLEKINDNSDDFYQLCIDLHEQKCYREIAQELIKFYSEDEIALTEEEFLTLYEIKEKEDCKDKKLSVSDVISQEVSNQIKDIFQEAVMDIIKNHKPNKT